MDDAGSFRKALERSRQKHRPSPLYHLAIPVSLLMGLGLSAALGQGKLDQLFAALFFLSVAVWAISDSHVFGLAVDQAAGLEVTEETVNALQREVASLKNEVADLRAKASDGYADSDSL